MAAVFRQLGLGLLLAITTAACAATGAVPRPFPGATAPPIATVPTPATPTDVLTTPPAATPLIATALSYRGVPYRNGGSDPSGFDCSGFVQWVFAQQGRALPREVHEQYQSRSVDRSRTRCSRRSGVLRNREPRRVARRHRARRNDDSCTRPARAASSASRATRSTTGRQRWVGARRRRNVGQITRRSVGLARPGCSWSGLRATLRSICPCERAGASCAAGTDGSPDRLR